MANGKEKSLTRTNAAFYGEPSTAAQSQDQLRGARDYLRGHAEKWLVENVSRARKCQRFEEALATITGCLIPQVRESGDLAETLAAFACIAVCKKRGRGKKSLEELLSIGTCKTWKALSEFPERLRRMAQEVEQINKSVLLAPPMYVNKKTMEAEIVRKRLNQLPGIMHLYATGLEMHIERMPKQLMELFRPSPNGEPNWLLLLSYSVRIATGKYRDREVAELLNTAAISLGEKKQFDALDIAQARSRHRRQTAYT